MRSLRGQVVTFTGRVLVDDEGTSQTACGQLVEGRGGRWLDTPSGAVTLVVHGDLAGKTVQDPTRGYSEKLVHAQAQRAAGLHVHVVDAAGFSDLLHRRAARCRRLRAVQGRGVVVQPEVDDLVLAEPFNRDGKPLPRTPAGRRLAVDLVAFDRASVAHERTVRALAAHLRAARLTPQLPARRGPQFDLGWQTRSRIHIAEIKSLTGADEAQQIRLGFGQVLDYQAQLAAHGNVAHAIVVLERRPKHVDRWQSLAAHTGATLTWAPGFPDLPIGAGRRR